MKGKAEALRISVAVIITVFLAVGSAQAEEKSHLTDRLARLRYQIMTLQQTLIDGLKSSTQAKSNIVKIKKLLALQKQEKLLGKEREKELEKTVGELELRRGVLHEKILLQQRAIRKSLAAIDRSNRGPGGEKLEAIHLPEQEKLEAPRRKVLSNLVDRGLKEIESLKVDLADAQKLETQIQEERQQLVYLFQDLEEQQSVLELNQQLQADLIRRKHHERLAQLENYRKLKNAESQVERLMTDFNAHVELEHLEEQERTVSKAMMQGVFAQLKGKLPLPVKNGSVLSGFGRTFDPRSKLYVFKKGIDISANKKSSVRAVSAGKIAYSGELPTYGQVTIIDHGEHFYSLCAHLGKLLKKAGDPVAAGEAIGLTDEQGTPLYFEIRSRNVAVNPLQWISN